MTVLAFHKEVDYGCLLIPLPALPAWLLPLLCPRNLCPLPLQKLPLALPELMLHQKETFSHAST